MVLCGSFPNEASQKTTATKKTCGVRVRVKLRLASEARTGASLTWFSAGADFLFSTICSFDFLSCCHFQGFIKYRHPADSCVGLKTFVYFGNNIVDSIKNLF